MKTTWIPACLALLSLGGLAACTAEDAPLATFDPDAPAPEKLTDTGLIAIEDGNPVYPADVVPYDLNSPLFSDYALKDRALWLPEGTAATYDDNDVLDFPVGTVILKTFSVPADFRQPEDDVYVVETRVLLKREDVWDALPYVWNEDATEATLALGGKSEAISFIDTEGVEKTASYLVPQKNQCIACHELKHEEGEPMAGVRYTTAIGPKARHMNRSFAYDAGTHNQLEHLASMGMLDGLPPLSEVGKAYDFAELADVDLQELSVDEVDKAARDYLDINCAHCHNPNGVNGISSQLFLNYDNEDPFHLGVCKTPGSAGTGNGFLDYDIVPGSPMESILWFRMDTTQNGAMMPLLGRSLRDDRAVELIVEWIANMDPVDCDASGG
jgi:uncharacterized repeat protein (TIGR03806 family)